MEINSNVCGICQRTYVGDYCPTCGSQTGTVPLTSADTGNLSNVCFTEPIEDHHWAKPSGGYTKTRPADSGHSETRPTFGVDRVPSSGTMPADYVITDVPSVHPVVPAYDPADGTKPPITPGTMPAPGLQQCVEGWLVATTGKNKGKDYQIRGFNTSIGREEGQIILNDPMVSRKNSCSIKYYSNTQEFFLYMGGNATNPVYINGTPLHEHQELHAYDDILIGGEHYVFIPLCGKMFQWKG